MLKHNSVTFEARCKLAAESLRGHQADIEKLQKEKLLELEQFKRERAFEPDPDDTSDPAVVKQLWEEWLAADLKLLTDFFNDVVKLEWEAAVKSVRTIFGDDATDFALEALKKQSVPN